MFRICNNKHLFKEKEKRRWRKLLTIYFQIGFEAKEGRWTPEEEEGEGRRGQGRVEFTWAGNEGSVEENLPLLT